MATQNINFNDVTSVSFNNNNVTEVQFNGNKIWPTSSTYGVDIDLNNSDPLTSVTYTDGAVGMARSYMNFSLNVFIDNGWGSKWPFNQIKPCLFKNGAVVKYLDPSNYSKDLDGNNVDITTGTDGDVMIEIPKIYYKISTDSINGILSVKISDTSQTGYCCYAHTYKGVEKDKIYVGAYEAAIISDKLRSLSGQSPTVSTTADAFTTSAHSMGDGYEPFYWHIKTLIQVLFLIRFKSLDSQSALGLGVCNNTALQNTGTRDQSGLNYGSNTAYSVKFLGIENVYGNLNKYVAGALYANTGGFSLVDVTSPTMQYPTSYNASAYTVPGTPPTNYLEGEIK